MEQLNKIGWTIAKADELERTSLEEPLLINNLIKQLKRINKANLSDGDINSILNELLLDWNFLEKIRTKRNGSIYYGSPISYED
ncbi:MAG: hypothetical protein QME12_01990 [Nanoarchaeota archaeon]|nr:hypothetical protein [Nanoarchaeota archaeon]